MDYSSPSMNHDQRPLIACHHCDLLQREIALPPKGAASCSRCGTLLYRNLPDSLNRSLALAVGAAVLFLMANSFPLLGIALQGDGNDINLLQAVRSLWGQGMHLISAVVFVTTVLVPALELTVLLYLLAPLRFGYVPGGAPLAMRLLRTIKPWSMQEVFMLGILVSLVKLVKDFRIIPGVALWSFGALTLVLAALASSFNPRDVWARLDREAAGGARQ